MVFETQTIKKILVIKLRHIGDVLLTVPTFRALREKFPDAHITALINSGTEEILTDNPLINEIILFDRNIKKIKNPVQKFLKELSFLRNIRSKNFDMTVDLTSGDRAATISFLSGAKYRFAHNPSNKGFLGKKKLYTHLSKLDGKKHTVLQNLDVVKQFGIDTSDLSVDLFIPKDATLFVKEVFKKNSIKGYEKVVHLHPTSRWIFKSWKDEYMAELITWFINNEVKVIITTSPNIFEMEKAKRILSLVAPHKANLSLNVIDLCGRTNIKQLAAISKASNLFIGVDSAPMHIAAAVGTPVIALFGPTGVFNWAPWHSKKGKNPHVIVRKNWACEPCGRGLCENNISKCLYDIKPQEIINILKNYFACPV